MISDLNYINYKIVNLEKRDDAFWNLFFYHILLYWFQEWKY